MDGFLVGQNYIRSTSLSTHCRQKNLGSNNLGIWKEWHSRGTFLADEPHVTPRKHTSSVLPKLWTLSWLRKVGGNISISLWNASLVLVAQLWIQLSDNALGMASAPAWDICMGFLAPSSYLGPGLVVMGGVNQWRKDLSVSVFSSLSLCHSAYQVNK